MQESALVSVIIPTYKTNVSLQNAVNSVLKQTYLNIEIIVVDDNNPETPGREQAEKIMIQYQHNDKVKYIKHDKNKNGSAARNTGFAHSLGKYICLLDDDDIFLPNKVRKQVEYLCNNQEFEAVYCYRYHNNNIVMYNKEGDLSKELLTLRFMPYTSSIMITREAYGTLNGFDETYKRHQDIEFLLRYFQKYKIGVVSEPLIHIKGNDVNNTLHGVELEKLKTTFLEQFNDIISSLERNENGFRRKVYSINFSIVFLDYLKKGDFKRAFTIFRQYSKKYGIIFCFSIFNHIQTLIRVKLGKKAALRKRFRKEIQVDS